MTADEFAEILDMIIDRAPRLRAAGIPHVNIEGISFEVAGDPAPPKPADDQVSDDDDDLNPLEDPTTFGRSRKRKAPTFRGDE